MPKIRVLATTLAGVTLVLSCSPQAPKFAFKHAEKRGVITKNGLRFVIMPDDTTQLAEVDIRYDVGSREDPSGKSGLAHLVEHLMFQTRPDGPNTAPLFQTIIDLTSDFNAYTNWDTTHYRLTSRAENLDAMLKIEAMRMYYAADLPPFGCSTLPEAEFEREREVVRNEIRAGSSAEGYVAQLVEAAIYPKGHAYERMIGGNDQQIASASLADACTFMKKYYAPERATIVVAGGVDFDTVAADIEKWFGKIPKREGAPRAKVTPFTVPHDRQEIQADVERPAVWVGWVLPASNTPEGEAARFGIGAAYGRIAEAGEEYGFAYSVQPAFFGGELAPVFLMRIELKGLGKLDEALEFVQKSAKQAYRGFDEGTFEQIEESKNREKASFIAGLERLRDRTETVAGLVQFSTDFDFNSTDMYLFHQLDKIAKFDNATVGSAVKKALAWDKAAIIVVKPNAEGIKGDTRSKVRYAAKSDAAMTDVVVDPSEAKRPVRLATGPDVLDRAKRFKLGNGMQVVLLQVKSMPLAAARLIFSNVGTSSTPNSPALAAAAADFLHLPIDAEAFARSGVRVGCAASLDSTTCSTHGVNIYLDVMLKGLERLVKAGDYEQSQIESWQKSVKEDFQTKSQRDETEYERQFYFALYGPEHPYTKTAVVTPEVANKVHRDALADFRHNHFTASNATLVVVGDFDVKYAENLARDTFGDWDSGGTDKPVPAMSMKRTGPSYTGVVKNKVDQQITVVIAYPSVGGIDGQEGARQVLSEMINYRAGDVRFKLGSTYGLGFARRPQKGGSSYQLRGGAEVGGTIDAERAGESIKALRESLDALRAGERFDDDFVRARRKILSTMLGESTVTTELATRLGFVASFGLAADYNKTLLQQIAAVSPAQVRALMKHELDPNNEVIVVLGDKAHLEKTFSESGLKDVKFIEPDYKK